MLGMMLAFVRVTGLPLPELVLTGGCGLLLLEKLAAGKPFTLRGTTPLLLTFCLWVLLIPLTGGAEGLASLKNTLQPVLAFFVAVSAFRSSDLSARRTLPRLILIAWCLSAGVAVGQLVAGTPLVNVAGGMGSRAVYGFVMAVLAPFALSAVHAEVTRESLFAILASVLCLAGILTITYLPMLVLFVLTSLGWLFTVREKQALRTAGTVTACLLCVIVAGIVPPAAERFEQLRASIATHDDAGVPRRWQLEVRAAARAIAARPLRGYGPGRYQDVVSSAEWRAALPMTRENRVEPDTQSGLVVLTVEYGLPAAFLFLAGILAVVLRGIRSGAPPEYAWSLVAVALGSVATVPLLGGIEVVPGILAGVILFFYDRGRPSRRPSIPGQLLGQGIIIAVAIAAAGLVFALGSTTDEEKGDVPYRPGGQQSPAKPVLALEIEDAAAIPAPFEIVEDPAASAGRALRLGELSKARMLRLLSVPQLQFEVDKPGTYQTWLHARWRDGCANSVAIKHNDAPAILVGNDGLYQQYHWVKGPELTIGAGTQRIGFEPRESFVQLDLLVLAKPGNRPPPQIQRTAATPPADDAAVPSLTIDERAPRERFLAATGGAYANGPEAIFQQMGIPYERLRVPDLTDAEALAKYQVVWLSGPNVMNSLTFWQAARKYMEDGGTMILELPPRRFHSRRLDNAIRNLVPFVLDNESDNRFNSPYYGGRTVSDNGSPWFRFVEDSFKLSRDVVIQRFGQLSEDDGTIHGNIHYTRRHVTSHVGVEREIGKGRLFYLPAPIGFAYMWRDDPVRELAFGMLLDAIDGRYDPLFMDLEHMQKAPSGLLLSDDFVRNRGNLTQWKLDEGTARISGGPEEMAANPEANPEEIPFSIFLEGPARIRSRQDYFSDIRASVAINTPEGAGGIWVSTNSGAEVQLVFDAAQGKMYLIEAGQDGRNLLEVADTEPPAAGWRRLSLLVRNRQYEAWIDGVRAFAHPAPAGATLSAPLGLIQVRGRGAYDEVQVVAADAVIPGTDKAWGESGSCMQLTRQQAGIEPNNILLPQWHLRPDPLGRHAVRTGLPLYTPATLQLDGETVGKVSGSGRRRQPVPLPEGQKPDSGIKLVNASWHDYNFEERLTDWYSTGREWSRLPRWSCDTNWEWFGVKADSTPAVLWHRPRLTDTFAATVLWVPVSEVRRGTDTEKPRDLNFVIGGNGKDLTQGLQIRTDSGAGKGITLIRDGEVIARNRDVGIPTGMQLALHHIWVKCDVVVTPDRLQLFIQDEKALDVELEEPVPAGRFGLWTVNNTVQLAKATLSYP